MENGEGYEPIYMYVCSILYCGADCTQLVPGIGDKQECMECVNVLLEIL